MINAKDKPRYEAIVVLENAQTRLQMLLSKMITDFIERQQVGQKAKQIIKECLEDLKEFDLGEQFLTDAETSLKGTFFRWYDATLQRLLALGKITKNPLYFLSFKKITGITPKVDKDSQALVIALEQTEGFEVGSIKNIREFLTTGETGYSQLFIEDYQDRVDAEIKNIASKNLVMLDKNGRRLSIRNLAEMTIRFEELEKDAEKLKAKGVKFAYASSHSNASVRCSIWQGRLYLIDVELGSIKPGKVVKDYKPQPIGKIDGIEYFSLLDAVNHGFLGYNCRHRLVAYQKGMTKPREYPANRITNERSKEQTLRAMENNIRKVERLAILSTTEEERKEYKQKAKGMIAQYWSQCKKWKYPVAEWRTEIGLAESKEIPNISFDETEGMTYGEFINK